MPKPEKCYKDHIKHDCNKDLQYIISSICYKLNVISW